MKINKTFLKLASEINDAIQEEFVTRQHIVRSLRIRRAYMRETVHHIDGSSDFVVQFAISEHDCSEIKAIYDITFVVCDIEKFIINKFGAVVKNVCVSSYDGRSDNIGHTPYFSVTFSAKFFSSPVNPSEENELEVHQ